MTAILAKESLEYFEKSDNNMALISTRSYLIRGLRCQYLNHGANLLSRSPVSNEQESTNPVLANCSRRNIGAFPSNCTTSRLFETSNDNPKHRFRIAGALFGTLAFVAGYVTYLKRKSLLVNVQPPLSAVCAAEIDNSELPPRQRFNFVADVVEKAAPAVVYIEIKGRYAVLNYGLH